MGLKLHQNVYKTHKQGVLVVIVYVTALESQTDVSVVATASPVVVHSTVTRKLFHQQLTGSVRWCGDWLRP